MSRLESELELESLEFESFGEAEAEQEAFFNHLAAMADRGGRSQALRRVALAAAREALRGARRPWPAIEGEQEFELESEGEGEFELEGSFELEALLNPAQRGAALAMMEHMAHEAAHAENEQEAAEQFLPRFPSLRRRCCRSPPRRCLLLEKLEPKSAADCSAEPHRGCSTGSCQISLAAFAARAGPLSQSLNASPVASRADDREAHRWSARRSGSPWPAHYADRRGAGACAPDSANTGQPATAFARLPPLSSSRSSLSPESPPVYRRTPARCCCWSDFGAGATTGLRSRRLG